ncbi:hypothetical protein ANANG_G00111950 [Anguilla anguilla]|uniref:Uncharacterized protein n=1 Tax=Anguilla anguilla TaxID=7936 RepID=A0A9D3MKI1_ANGAN|nr:hypothetical protein ANANG_G00111950 [Anguilla anguilla]
MAEKKAVELWQKEMAADSCDSDEEQQMMEDYLKQRKLMKKMKKEQTVQKHGKTEKGVGEIQWERHSESSGTKWGQILNFREGC